MMVDPTSTFFWGLLRDRLRIVSSVCSRGATETAEESVLRELDASPERSWMLRS
jgi:hypothetical protein